MELPDETGEVIFKFLLAIALSGVIGLEREHAGRGAGLRTHMLVCLGATFTMAVGGLLADYWNAQGGSVWLDRGRIAQGIITGVGFLGAGTIIVVRGALRGLTTAATIWFVATLGIAVGAGFYSVAATATAFALLVVTVLRAAERRLPAAHYFSLEVRMPRGLGRVAPLENAIRDRGFKVLTSGVEVSQGDDHVNINFEVSTRSSTKVERLVEHLDEWFPDAVHVKYRRRISAL